MERVVHIPTYYCCYLLHKDSYRFFFSLVLTMFLCSYFLQQLETADLGTPLPLQLLKGIWNHTESQNGSHWKGPQQVIWSNLTAQAGSFQGTWHRFASRWLLSVSSKGDSMFSLGNRSQCLVTRTANSSSCSGGTSHSSVSACCLSSYCLASLSRAWLRPLDTLPSDIYRYWWDPFSLVSSHGWRGLASSAFPRKRDAPVLSSSL